MNAIFTAITTALTNLTNFVWGIPMLVILVGGGVILTVRLGFFQFGKFGYIMSQTFGKIFKKSEGEGTVSPFQAACSALASSIGAANIVGVPTAIALGGPGAVFWMWITALIGSATKFSEVALGIKYREQNAVGEFVGGPAYYLKKGIKGPVGKVFAFMCAFFFMLEIVPSISVQSLSVCTTAEAIGIPKLVTAIFVLAITALVVCGGIKRIGAVTEKMVPLMALAFTACALIIIGANITAVPEAFMLIFKGAFTTQAAVGGFTGSVIANSIRWGMARGSYSNEAGMGSAPYAHSAAVTDHPARQGLWGVFEVFVDTICICTLTALTVITTGAWKMDGLKPEAMPAFAFTNTFGAFGGVILSVCLLLFVLSTILVIVFYCEKNAEALFGLKFSRVMRYVCLAAIIYGAVGNLASLYTVLDFLLMLVVIPNMIGLVMLSGEVKEIKDDFFSKPELYNRDKLEAAAAKTSK
ncbi:MAG: sodium:alanine symporter family protein [Ruthenibacterium sp.]